MNRDQRDRVIIAELPKLRRYALALCKDRERAEDLVQETALRALANIDKWQPGTNLTAWVMTIMHNLFVNEVTRKRISSAGTDARLADIVQPGNAQEDWHQMRDVSRAYRSLPSFQREVMWRACVEGQDFSEISDQLHISQSTVRSRLFRARLRIRDHLKSDT